MKPCTTFAGGINPFLPRSTQSKQEQEMKKPSTPAKPVQRAETQFFDPNDLEITDDVMPANRCAPEFKYKPIFDKMKVGQAMRCTTDAVGKVAGQCVSTSSSKAERRPSQ